jgi:elongator complex protein 1
MPELRRRHAIDNHLGRYAKALTSLHADNAHEDLKLYAIKHSLYKEALELHKYQPDQHKDMTRVYADYLHDKSNFKEAGIGKLLSILFPSKNRNNIWTPTAYESLSDYKQAYQCYHLAHLWCESLFCASLVGMTEEQLAEHAITLATTLIEESKDYVSAAQIHSQHLNDIPTAARLLCRGSKFADACRLLALHGKHSLIPEIVDSGLADAMGSTTDLLADCKNQLNSQVPRIAELRVRRAADPLAFFGGDPAAGAGADGIDIPDNVSLAPTDATTMADRSMFTRYTSSTSMSRQTSKNRRKEERKRARGKKGTVYEEEYLVNSVRRLVQRVNDAVGEVETLVQALLRRGMRERAAAIERGLDEVLSLCRDCLGPVFEVDGDGAVEENKAGTEPGPTKSTGADGVLFESLAERDGKGTGRQVPTVREFKKLVLLGG